ncbi:uncharacterized protein LOC144031178 isoform X3 [Festucalex cinctus]
MVTMKFCAAAALLLLFMGPSKVFGLLPTRDRDRSFRTRTMTQDSSVPPELPVIWTELVGLRQLVLSLQAAVVDQRQSLRTSESRLRDGQEAAEKQRQRLDAVQMQMDVDRKMVLSLQAAAVEQRHALRTAENRLADREEAAEKQRQVVDSLQVQVEADKKMVSQINGDLKRSEEHRQEEMSRLQSRLNTTESSVEDLKRKTSALAGDLPFLRTRLRASESTLDQLKRKSSVLASRLCLVENLRKRSSVEEAEVQGHQNSSRGHTTASTADKDGQRREPESRLDTDSSRIHQNMSALHARLVHLEGQVMTGERQLQDIRAAVVNTLNDTQTQSEGLKVRLSVVENRVADLWTDKSVKSSQLSNMEVQLANICNNTAALEGSVRTAEARVEKLTVLNSALEGRFNFSEKLLDELKTESAAHATQLDNAESRLTYSIAALDVRLNVSGKLHEQLRTECRGELLTVTERLKLTEGQVGDLWMNNAAQTTQLSDILDWQSRTMRDTAVLEVRLNTSDRLLEELETECAALAGRLNASEKLLEELKTACSARTSRLYDVESRLIDIHNFAALARRLNVSEKLMDELRTECSAQTRQLSDVESRLTRNIHNTEVLLGRLNTSEQKMIDLKATTEELMLRLHVLEQRRMQTSGEAKVAFAAALTDSGSVGPFDLETTLIFSKVFTNVGRAYDETSGVFTAPVGGVYVFSFTAADFLKGYMGVTLYRNQQPIVSSLDLNDHGGYASATNGALIPLEAGDRVRLSLPATYRLYDDARSFSVFSGFLLFPLEAQQ